MSALNVQLVNHASVKIRSADATILTDPWYEKPAFNGGWELLVSEPDMAERALEGVTHIWISHEHPDHFVPAFFMAIPQELRERIPVLFQTTEDKRVAGFLRKKGFTVVELDPGERYRLGATELEIGPIGFYDSYLWVSDGQRSILNMNDCNIGEVKILRRLREELGAPDLLLTQFSYAAWKGGRENLAYREQAAREKLDVLALQTRELGAKVVMPFASFVWFCHEENDYMNLGVNTIESVVSRSHEYDAQLLVLEPFSDWTIGEAIDNTRAETFWREQHASVATRPRKREEATYDLGALRDAFDAYQERVLSKNSGLFLKFGRYNPLLRGFEPVAVRLSDLDKTIMVSVVDGFGETLRITPDVTMHSASLMLIFKADFGYDTLMVNGRFEATKKGFSRMTRSFAIGSLNAMGISLGPRALLRPEVFLRLFRLLGRVGSRLRANPST